MVSHTQISWQTCSQFIDLPSSSNLHANISLSEKSQVVFFLSGILAHQLSSFTDSLLLVMLSSSSTFTFLNVLAADDDDDLTPPESGTADFSSFLIAASAPFIFDGITDLDRGQSNLEPSAGGNCGLPRAAHA
mmetsp:Transcript_13026/g.28198  ORF Transcript_13026/g.28198 Transcript_13026/m.28198 type:complete len:133 (+) Transcript_13026:26-424(+)